MVVALPNTPQKDISPMMVGVSSQILPLSRLSLSSNNSSPDQPVSSKVIETPTGRPVAEVQPFSGLPDHSSSDRSKVSPAREKFDKIRRSLTEPLLQYFHDLQTSPDGDEPEVLNTPKSLTPPARLLTTKTAPKLQSVTVTDM